MYRLCQKISKFAAWRIESCGAPHIHIDYIPVARNLTRGMSVQNSLTKALEQQGIKTIEQISQKENLVKKGKALRKKIEDMSRS